MTKRARRNHSPAFKAKVALAAIKARRRWPSWRSNSTFTPIRSRNGRRSFWEGLRDIGSTRQEFEVAPCEDRSLTLENDLEERLSKVGHAWRKAMIDKKRGYPITRQAKALKLSAVASAPACRRERVRTGASSCALEFQRPEPHEEFLRIMWLVLGRSSVDVCMRALGLMSIFTLRGNIRDYVEVCLQLMERRGRSHCGSMAMRKIARAFQSGCD